MKRVMECFFGRKRIINSADTQEPEKQHYFSAATFLLFIRRPPVIWINCWQKKADAFSVFDCCGKPVAELGLEEREKVILERLNKKLLAAGAREVVMVCPNCYAFLKGRLSIPVIGIYEKLQELGLGAVIVEEQNIFLPCPDREKKEL